MNLLKSDGLACGTCEGSCFIAAFYFALALTLGKKEACFLMAENSGSAWQKNDGNGNHFIVLLHFNIIPQPVLEEQILEQPYSIILVGRCIFPVLCSVLLAESLHVTPSLATLTCSFESVNLLSHVNLIGVHVKCIHFGYVHQKHITTSFL